jgi:hypothetical protein
MRIEGGVTIKRDDVKDVSSDSQIENDKPSADACLKTNV